MITLDKDLSFKLEIKILMCSIIKVPNIGGKMFRINVFSFQNLFISSSFRSWCLANFVPARILFSPDTHLFLSRIIYLRRCKHIHVYIVLISDLLPALISSTQVREHNEKRLYCVSGKLQQKIRKEIALMFYHVASARRPIRERNDFQIHFVFQ